MNKIPTHKLSVIFNGKNVYIRRMYYRGKCPYGKSVDEADYSQMDYAHRDDYYIFFLIKDGGGKGIIDFEEYEFSAGMVHCIMPGQVHQATGDINADGWLLMVDNLSIKSEYKEILVKKCLNRIIKKPSKTEMDELEACLILIEQRINRNEYAIEQNILSDLISSYIGMVANIYHKEFPVSLNNRSIEITLQFKELLSKKYQTIKRPAQYAKQMNISPIYLNEIVKKTTGVSVSTCIRDEIVLQAKRLLYHTTLTIKEISINLGYEDWAYFTRLFTKATGVPPSQFRKENLDLSKSNIL